ncbi:MAG: hypothetical protein LBH43_11965 [Treponema sp.]|nr:hypothetical protein [Treponema sp.]
MKKTVFGILFFLISCLLFAQTDMGRYREIQIDSNFRIYILKSQRCADIDSAWDFWSNNVFLWGSRWIINNQQDSKDYPDAMWKQASDNMFQQAWDVYHNYFDDGVAYVVRTVNNINNEYRIIDQRIIYYSPDGKTVWYYYSLSSLYEYY